ncbi:Protein LOL3 [Dichanthelium oligosanthes]|uniref:Protein LOL3 n=1 Tax=Dichanthelium oligosanthes TaxID=888268 RepID=A0A1E5UJN6_9POAL|nr:Protein LOL3 [Dichanthelium oligosanthes]
MLIRSFFNSISGMQSQIVCHACRTVLLYPQGAPSVCCAVCQAVTTVPPPGTLWMLGFLSSELGGGNNRLYTQSCSALAARNSWRCNNVLLVRFRVSRCLTRDGSAYMWRLSNFADVYSQCRHLNNIAHVNCGHCQITLMYPYGAHSVKCAICNHITATGVNMVAPTTSARPASNGSSYSTSSTSVPKSQPQNVTVVVENPMTVDDKGKLVSNVVVGVTTGKN